MIEAVKRHAGVAAAYTIAGTAIYWIALRAFFVSDDFEFLTIVASAKSWLVIFEPLVGRYVRPFVVLMYYACYRVFGLTPWPYHVATLAPHLISAFLVYLVALRLFPGRSRLLPFLAGSLFLVFSGHSEAVAWPAGIADPIVAVALLMSFLLYLRACEAGASRWYVLGSYVAMWGAVLTKEIWVTYPGILLAHAVLLGERTAQARRRAVILVVASGATVVAYVLMRQLVFGSVAGGYSGLGTSFGTALWFAEVRAFVLRCFVPAGPLALRMWRRDLLAWSVVAALLIWRARGRSARVVLFSACSMMLALLPVLPLTISVATTESERFTYVATVFSCLLVVSGAAAVLRARALVVAACAALMAWHGVVLVQNTIRWGDAGELARGIIGSFAHEVRQHDPEGREGIFLLNLPDNLHGAYVYRRGFYPAIQLFAPAAASSTARTTGIATNAFGTLHDRYVARQTGTNSFQIDIAPSMFVQPEIPSSTWYQITRQQRSSYDVTFADTISSAIVLYTTDAGVAYVGTATSRGVPFGTIDIPTEGAACAGEAIRFSGWALDDRGVSRVVVETVDDNGAAGALGVATWSTGTRPDVASIFASLPNNTRAEWNYLLPCALVSAAPGGRLAVRVTAIDSDGQQAVLGVRHVSAAR